MEMTCPKCQKQFTKITAWECPITDTYICPECRVGLSNGVTDEIRVESSTNLVVNSNPLVEEGRLF